MLRLTSAAAEFLTGTFAREQNMAISGSGVRVYGVVYGTWAVFGEPSDWPVGVRRNLRARPNTPLPDCGLFREPPAHWPNAQRVRQSGGNGCGRQERRDGCPALSFHARILTGAVRLREAKVSQAGSHSRVPSCRCRIRGRGRTTRQAGHSVLVNGGRPTAPGGLRSGLLGAFGPGRAMGQDRNGIPFRTTR